MSFEDYEQCGKKFEATIAAAFRRDTGRVLERLTDINRNAQPCDYFALIPPACGRDGINLFLEVKWTSFEELPLKNIKQHQLMAMRDFDGHIPSCHAGFFIGLGPKRDRQLWYLSGSDTWMFCVANPDAERIGSAFLLTHGISVGYQFDIATRRLDIDFEALLSTLYDRRKHNQNSSAAYAA